MQAAQLTITTNTAAPILSGATVDFAATTAGLLASFNGNAITWANLTGCQVLSGNLLRDNASGANDWDVSGANSAASIASGEGYAEFVAASPQAEPGYPALGGRAFMAGLTSRTGSVLFSELDAAFQISEGNLVIYENGVFRRNLENPRIDGVYRVAVEQGQLVWRADNAIVYRSDQPVVYPLRFGARFFHRNSDQIGGTPSGTINWLCYDLQGNAVPAFSGATFTAPATRGRYKIVAETADFLYGQTYVQVQKRWPDEFSVSGFPPASKFLPLAPDWRVKRQEFDDGGVQTSTPYPNAQPTRKFRLTYTNMPKALADVLDAFALDHRNDALPFFFYDKRSATMLDNARITRYERDHRKKWIQSRTVEITYTPR